jgi:hypothetical protein
MSSENRRRGASQWLRGIENIPFEPSGHRKNSEKLPTIFLETESGSGTAWQVDDGDATTPKTSIAGSEIETVSRRP